MESTFMPMGYRTNNGYIVSDATMQELQHFFKIDFLFEVSPSDVLRIVDVFKALEKEKAID